MTRKLIIDGNAVYEIDEECMLKKRVDVTGCENGKRKRENESGYGQKSDQESTSGQKRLR